MLRAFGRCYTQWILLLLLLLLLLLELKAKAQQAKIGLQIARRAQIGMLLKKE